MSKRNKEFAVPQKEADKLKHNASAAGAVFLVGILAAAAIVVGFALYWTQIKDKELPVRVDMNVSETPESN